MPYNPVAATPVAYTTTVWALPLSLTTTQGILSVPPGTEMFQFPGLPPSRLCVQREVTWVYHVGFPHSGILGSKHADSSPRLIAANHALHRPAVPRHPPCALCSFTYAQPHEILDSCSAVKVPSRARASRTPSHRQLSRRRPLATTSSRPPVAARTRAPRPSPLSRKRPGAAARPMPAAQRPNNAIPLALDLATNPPLSGASDSIARPARPVNYPRDRPPMELRGLEPLASSLQMRRSPT